MELENPKNLLIKAKKINVGNGIFWQFNDTTITINGSPVTRYLLYQEKETDLFVLMTTQPLEVAEDYFISIEREERSPYTLVLTPRFSKHEMLILKEE